MCNFLPLELVVKDPFEELLTYEVVEESQEPHKVKVILLKNTDGEIFLSNNTYLQW